jgi:hypothetical protein
MFLGAATRPTEDGPHFKKQHITSNNSRKFQGAGRRLQGTMKMEAGRWKREAKTSASDRVQVTGCKSQVEAKERSGEMEEGSKNNCK